jgi:hypothetical protein
MIINSNQKQRVAFIVPRMPPSVDGVGDYTCQLLRHSARLNDSIILVENNTYVSKQYLPEHLILELPKSSVHFLSLLDLYNINTLILQYSAFGFSKRGCPLSLLKNIKNWSEKHPNNRLIVMIHELWYITKPWKYGFYLQLLHQYLLLLTLKQATTVFTSTDGYCSTLRTKLPTTQIAALPVGSNIVPKTQPSTLDKIRNTWILFGKQANRVSALQDFASWLPKLYEAGLLIQLSVVGPTDNESLSELENRLLHSLLPPDKVVQFGALASVKLSNLMSSCEYGIFAQTPLSWQKSTIFMAYAAHCIEVVAPFEWPSESKHAHLISSPSSLINDSRTDKNNLAKGFLLGSWYEKSCSWQLLAKQYESQL